MRRVQRIRQHLCAESRVDRSDTLSSSRNQDLEMFDFTHWDLDNHDLELFADQNATVAWDSFLQDIILP
jgi:hypothetical protein